MANVKEMFQIDIPTLLMGVLVVVGGLKVVIDLAKWVCAQFGIEFKHVRKMNEEHDALVKTMGRLDELEKQHKKDTEEFYRHDAELNKSIEKVTEEVNRLSTKIDEMMKKDDETVQASLKDRIAQLYRRYTVDKQWTKMEKESFTGLIRDYEAHGGKNSFVHSVCEPESFTWVVIDEEPSEQSKIYEEYR